MSRLERNHAQAAICQRVAEYPATQMDDRKLELSEIHRFFEAEPFASGAGPIARMAFASVALLCRTNLIPLPLPSAPWSSFTNPSAGELCQWFEGMVLALYGRFYRLNRRLRRLWRPPRMPSLFSRLPSLPELSHC
jgi:hypothetical protein